MKYLFLALLALSCNVFAIGLGNDNPGGSATAVAAASNSARIDNDVRANASAWQAQVQGQAQQQAITVNAGTAAAPVSLSLQEAAQPNKVEVRNVPSVFSGNVYPTAPCMGSSTVGGAGVGFGFSIGSSWTDDECGIRETARSFNGMGMKEDALQVLCTSKYAAAAPACQRK